MQFKHWLAKLFKEKSACTDATTLDANYATARDIYNRMVGPDADELEVQKMILGDPINGMKLDNFHGTNFHEQAITKNKSEFLQEFYLDHQNKDPPK